MKNIKNNLYNFEFCDESPCTLLPLKATFYLGMIIVLPLLLLLLMGPATLNQLISVGRGR